MSLFGPDHAPASPLVSPASAKEPPTSAISGQNSIDSSASADLQRSLENKLRARMAAHGSLEYELTWKHWDMPAGQQICAQRAVARRISANGCTGWPTPNAIPETRGGLQSNPEKAMERRAQGHAMNLDDAATLTGWPIAQSRDWKNGQYHNGKNARPLNEVAQLTGWSSPRSNKWGFPDSHGSHETPLNGWSTPTVNDSRSGRNSTANRTNPESNHNPGQTLVDQTTGLTTSSGHASTERRGALAPEFSLWLQAFPPEWLSCAPLVMRLSRLLLRSSSKPT